MRISDWSSDVCSSDLRRERPEVGRGRMRVDSSGAGIGARRRGRRGLLQGTIGAFQDARDCLLRGPLADDAVGQGPEISEADRRAHPLALRTRAPASETRENNRGDGWLGTGEDETYDRESA